MKAKTINFISLKEKELLKLSEKMLLSLDLTELKVIQHYFRKLKRNPTDVELETIAQTWSEHCKHKTFNSRIFYNENEKKELIESLFKEYIEEATKKIAKKVDWLVSVFNDNAGIISFNEKFDVAFKVETHNHPSALDPYGGANTGVGGVVRDILGCGLSAMPIANTDVFCFAEPFIDSKKIPKEIMHPKRILKGVRAGVRDYGNRLGIPTVNGAIFFDERFLGNPLVFCGTIGLIPKGMHKKKVSPNELIVVVGGRTGRDGIHGATFSSKELKEGLSSSLVQLGNAIEEKKLIDFILRARDEKLFSFITDCGAGGFSSAIGESAKDCGAIVFLERAPLKYKGLEPWEIWLSESQERMILAVPKEKIERLKELAEIEEVELTVLGHYTNTNKLEVFHERDKVLDLDLKFLHYGLPKKKLSAEFYFKEKEAFLSEPKNYNQIVLSVLSMPNIASKEKTVRQYDHEVQARTIGKPFIGLNNDGPSDAAIIKVDFNDNKSLIISNGINPLYGDIDPYWMAASNIDEAIRNIIAVGGSIKKIALLDNFCWGNPEESKKLGELCRAVKACKDFALAFNAPFISGKDSFYNEFKLHGKTISIPGTLLISALGILEKDSLRQSMFFKKTNSSIYIVGETFNELGGSAYFTLNKIKEGFVPKVNARKALEIYNALNKANKKGLINAIHDLSDGGLITALAESAFSGMIGAEINLSEVLLGEKIERDDLILFSESNSRFIVEVKKEKAFEKIMKNNAKKIGKTIKEKRIKVIGLKNKKIIDLSLEQAKKAWKQTLWW